MPNRIDIQRESTEYIYVTVTDETGTVTTAGIRIALTRSYDRPADSDWSDAVLVNGRTATLISGRKPGQYNVWSRVADSPQDVVQLAGALRIN